MDGNSSFLFRFITIVGRLQWDEESSAPGSGVSASSRAPPRSAAPETRALTLGLLDGDDYQTQPQIGTTSLGISLHVQTESCLLNAEPRAVSVRQMPGRSGLGRCITHMCSAAELEFPLEGVSSAEDGTYSKLTDTAAGTSPCGGKKERERPTCKEKKHMKLRQTPIRCQNPT
ncbi:hypothetical protein EYF80_059092 [Liparis tanakae]|uniref:Uncharacterized protein n=1 Tax=Liparis tanakae TaxID=230148 RepID=A0A4Z2EPC9_9TELE|nr:hypothetical protein EYF80_059092 [Liparis tanakae]